MAGLQDSVSLAELARILWISRWLIVVLGLMGGAALTARAFLAAPVYRTQALVAIADNDNIEIPDGLGAVGALASLTGINLGGASGRRAEYVALLTSRRVISELVQEQALLTELVERKTPDDALKNAGSDQPLVNDAVALFLEDVLTVTENVRTGLISIQIEWTDRVKAAAWANELVSLVNKKARENAITEATQTVEFLNRELERTDLLTVREGIYRLLEANMSRAALANVRDQYALRIIDPAFVPNESQFVRPRRLIEAIIGVVLGMMLGGICGLLRGRKRLWR